ncbi:MAG TPA: hypothetical protein VF663_09690 [Telluria sp.]
MHTAVNCPLEQFILCMQLEQGNTELTTMRQKFLRVVRMTTAVWSSGSQPWIPHHQERIISAEKPFAQALQ